MEHAIILFGFLGFLSFLITLVVILGGWIYYSKKNIICDYISRSTHNLMPQPSIRCDNISRSRHNLMPQPSIRCDNMMTEPVTHPIIHQKNESELKLYKYDEICPVYESDGKVCSIYIRKNYGTDGLITISDANNFLKNKIGIVCRKSTEESIDDQKTDEQKINEIVRIFMQSYDIRTKVWNKIEEDERKEREFNEKK
jgi:hypothetical protein